MPRVRLGATDAELVGVTLAIKLVLLIAGIVALYAASGALPDPLEPWHRWDAPHYTDLAVFGYRGEDAGTLVPPPGYRQTYPGDLDLYIVFFPLYPWLVGAVNLVLGLPVVSAFVVSTVASLFV